MLRDLKKWGVLALTKYEERIFQQEGIASAMRLACLKKKTKLRVARVEGTR